MYSQNNENDINKSLSVFNDGIYFINIYSKARTTLGRNLSNFSHHPFTHPKYGSFASVEGAFYYWSTGKVHEKLRCLHGYEAKKEGIRVTPKEWASEKKEIPEIFKDFIKECIREKLKAHPEILIPLISNNLPLKHFYVVGDTIVNKEKYKWITDEIEYIRDVTQKWYIKKYGKLPEIPLEFIS